MTAVTSRIEMYGYFVICNSSERPDGFPADHMEVGPLLVAHSSTMSQETTQLVAPNQLVTVVACFAPSIPFKWWSGRCHRVPNDFGPSADLNYQMPYGMVINVESAIRGDDPRCSVNRGVLEITPMATDIQKFSDLYFMYESDKWVCDFRSNLAEYYGITRKIDLKGHISGCLIVSPAANLFSDGSCTINLATVAPGALWQDVCQPLVFSGFAADSREALLDISIIAGFDESDPVSVRHTYNRYATPISAYMPTDRFDGMRSETILDNQLRNTREFDSLSVCVVEYEPVLVAPAAENVADPIISYQPAAEPDEDDSTIDGDIEADLDEPSSWPEDTQEEPPEEAPPPPPEPTPAPVSDGEETETEPTPVTPKRNPFDLDESVIQETRAMAPELIRNGAFVGSIITMIGRPGASLLRWKTIR